MSVSISDQKMPRKFIRIGQIFTMTKLNHAKRVFIREPLLLPLYILALPVVIMIRLIRPWLLVRFGGLLSPRIGHFAGNTELYFCERDAGINIPEKRHLDLFYMSKPISNQQLADMWRRMLRILPFWILAPIYRVNKLIPCGAIHEIGENTQIDRDVHNLLDRFPPHLEFTTEEEVRGKSGLLEMGIPAKTPFVCLIVRDNAYLNAHLPSRDWNYHNFRDSNIQNYVLAAEELAEHGYFVLRMGAKVKEAMQTSHPMVIDYASNGMRSDFMDIYLGAKCTFCISVGTGFDAIPVIFRKPIVYVNYVSLGFLATFRSQYLGITKHHILPKENRELTFSEIFSHVGLLSYASEYESRGIQLIQNTPQEIRDVVIEMAKRVNDSWQPDEDDEFLQNRFWEIFPKDAVAVHNGRPLHGEIRARFGAHFLRNNRELLN